MNKKSNYYFLIINYNLMQGNHKRKRSDSEDGNGLGYLLGLGAAALLGGAFTYYATKDSR